MRFLLLTVTVAVSYLCLALVPCFNIILAESRSWTQIWFQRKKKNTSYKSALKFMHLSALSLDLLLYFQEITVVYRAKPARTQSVDSKRHSGNHNDSYIEMAAPSIAVSTKPSMYFSIWCSFLQGRTYKQILSWLVTKTNLYKTLEALTNTLQQLEEEWDMTTERMSWEGTCNYFDSAWTCRVVRYYC